MLNRKCFSVAIVVLVSCGSSATGFAQDPAGNRNGSGTNAVSVLPDSNLNWDGVLAPMALTQPSSSSQLGFDGFPSLMAPVPTAPLAAAGRLDVAWNRAPSAGLEALPPPSGPTGAPESAAHFAGTVRGRLLQKTQPVANCTVAILPMNNDGFDQNRAPLTAVTDDDGRYSFNDVPVGSYKLAWLPAGSKQWIRRIELKPDVVVHAGQEVVLKEVRMALRTIN